MGQLDNVASVISTNVDVFALPGVVAVRPGYRIVNDWPTKRPVIAVLTEDGSPPAGLPPAVGGFETQVRTADPMERMAAQQNDRYQTLTLSRPEYIGSGLPLFVPNSLDPSVPAPEATPPAPPQIQYSGPDGVSLQKVSGRFKVVCHASPDAGWPTLKQFISDTTNKLTVGMYDFTSQHILDHFNQALAGKSLTLALDHPPRNPTAEQSDEETVQSLRDGALSSFDFGWAMVRGRFGGRPWVYSSAYHIKVSVRDSSAFWLSSGNFNNTNQPDFDPIGAPSANDQKTAKARDRDWHVLVFEPNLAGQFEAFIRNDESIAAANPPDAATIAALAAEIPPPDLNRITPNDFVFHPPLVIDGEDIAITPLLTPDSDSYRPHMLALIQSAKSRLYIQLQYIHPSAKPDDAPFMELVQTVADKIAAGLDVRIICSEFQAQKGGLEQLQDAGIPLDNVRIQNHIHNKGFVIDSKVVALGSQNWSGDGVLRNRDASVIIESATAAKYFEGIFIHDWDTHAVQRMNQEASSSPAVTDSLATGNPSPMKHVVAYFMHETEEAQAVQVVQNAVHTGSFIEGDLDAAGIQTLRDKGLIVRETDVKRQAPTPTHAAASMTMSVPDTVAASAVARDFPRPEDYYHLELRGPLVEERRSELVNLGVKLLSKLPSGYKVFMPTAQVPTVSGLSYVESLRWDDAPAPVSMVQTMAAVDQGAPKQFDIKANTADQLPSLLTWLQQQGIDLVGSAGRKARVRLSAGDTRLGQIATRPEVSMVTEYVEPVLFNDRARRLLGIEDGNGGTIALDGTGETLAIADTGIDQTHPAFTGRLAVTFGLGRPGVIDDPNGHGTHVAGSAAGDGAGSPGAAHRGMAPAARIVFQSLLDANGNLGGLPIDLGDLFQQAYDAGARIHTNSWGARMPAIYSMNSEEVDEFVWQHPDMLVIFAAGNEGVAPATPAHSEAGFVDWLSIGSPATAKNALTVGACRSDRTDGPFAGRTYGSIFATRFAADPIRSAIFSGDPECLAAFSSRGPCDNRTYIKPDVVAPGTEIASTCSSTAPAGSYEGPVAGAPRYAFDSGTSMATPLVAGCAVLVRQYFVNLGQAQPSAALLKATLINGTVFLTGPDANAPLEGRPNYHQGHGRIWMPLTVPNSLSPAGWTLRFRDNPARTFNITGERHRFQFNLPQASDELRFCLAYTDPPGRGIQNNLDLIVHHIESGSKFIANSTLPDVLVLPDPDNNVESIRIRNAPAGTYFVQVQAGNLLKAGQPYALVITGQNLSPITDLP